MSVGGCRVFPCRPGGLKPFFFSLREERRAMRSCLLGVGGVVGVVSQDKSTREGSRAPSLVCREQRRECPDRQGVPTSKCCLQEVLRYHEEARLMATMTTILCSLTIFRRVVTYPAEDVASTLSCRASVRFLFATTIKSFLAMHMVENTAV